MSDINRRPARSELKYGDTFHDFFILGLSGRGATGTVYKARCITDGQIYALKVLYHTDIAKRKRILSEWEVMKKFDHPNVVFCHALVEDKGLLAFVMDYIEGVQLDKWRDKWREEHQKGLDEYTMTCLFVDILRGLNHAHSEQVYHRDLKPANIMITKQDEGTWAAVIIDFGVARNAGDPIPEEDKDKIVGTAAYMSPEEIRDPERTCYSSDLYSVGIMMFETACGKRPFEGPVPNLMISHVKEEPPDLLSLNPELSPEFVRIINSLIAKTPGERPSTVTEVIDALERNGQRLHAQRQKVSRLVVPENEEDDDGDTQTPVDDQVAKDALATRESLGHSARAEGLFFSLRNFIASIYALILARFKPKLENGRHPSRLQIEDEETLSLDTSYTLETGL